MRRIRRRRLVGLWAALILVGAGASVAADTVARQWTEMSLEDIDVHPFEWSSSTCTVGARTGGGTLIKDCVISLRVPDYYDDGTGKSTDEIWITWMEQEPPGDECEQLLTPSCSAPNESRFFVASGERAIKVFPFPFTGDHGATTRELLAWNRDAAIRIFEDVIARLELYAVPCTCGGRPVGASAGANPPRSRGRETGSISYDELPRVGPDDRVVTPGGDLLGQGDEDVPCFENTPCASDGRAMRRTGGFPPDVAVASLRFFPSADHVPPQDQRAYSSRFSQAIDYLNVELNLTYPERDERFPFEMEVVVLENGVPYATFSRSMSLEPGWISSHHSAGYGRDGGGFWAPGRYEVEVSVKGTVVATGSFEIASIP